MSALLESKNRLCRMLAMENLNIVHKAGARTASINLASRTVTLPVWKDEHGNDMPSEVLDILISHEGYGHAVNTPKEGWHSELDGNSRGFKSYLNIVEDARIEKLVKRKYPGIRRSYFIGYKWIMDKGIFGDNLYERVNDGTLSLIDRLNLHAKVGDQMGVKFTEKENVWVDRLMNTETWKDVVVLSKELFELAKTQKSETDFDDMETGDGRGNDSDSDGDFGDGDPTETDDSGDATGNDPDDGAGGQGSGSSGGRGSVDDDDLIAETDQNFEKNMEELSGNSGGFGSDVIITLPTNTNPTDYIIGYKTIIKELQSRFSKSNISNAKGQLKKYQRTNKKIVSHLMKEFEMKKAADAYARTTVSKTGVLDPAKLHSYQYNDDVFKRVSTVSEGKNHGLLMYVDWSSSMRGNIHDTIMQTLNLVSFCRQSGIPFKVYAFTDSYGMMVFPDPKIGEIIISQSTKLLELFSCDMSKKEYNLAVDLVYTLIQTITNPSPYVSIPKGYRLGGTPLDATILIAMEMVNPFKEKYRVQVLNTVFLTDGASFRCGYAVASSTTGKVVEGNIKCSHKDTKSLLDPVTKKSFKMKMNDDTTTLLTALRELRDVEVAGFFIAPSTGYAIDSMLSKNFEGEKIIDLKTRFKEGETLISTQCGYSELYVINQDKMSIQNKPLSTEWVNVQTAMNIRGKENKQARVMLTKFIELITK